MNKRIQDLLKLLYTYNTQNSQEVAEELLKLQIHENVRIITLDVKDMYVNLPIPEILLTTSLWLNKHNNYNKQRNEHILHILNVILRQNYFQHEGRIFQPEKRIAMGSPLSSTIAEIYIRYFENIYIKHWLDSKEIVFYKLYVDDIMILYDQQKTDKHTILQKINEIDKHLQFKISTEVNNKINKQKEST